MTYPWGYQFVPPAPRPITEAKSVRAVATASGVLAVICGAAQACQIPIMAQRRHDRLAEAHLDPLRTATEVKFLPEEPVSGIQVFLEVVMYGCGLAAIVTFLIFLYGLVAVAEDHGRPPRYSQGMAVGMWFIPGANFLMPYFLVRDLWRAQHNRRDHPITLVVTWWAVSLLSTAMFLLGVILGFRAGVASVNNQDGSGSIDDWLSLPGIKALYGAEIIGAGAALASGVAMLLLVRRMTEPWAPPTPRMATSVWTGATAGEALRADELASSWPLRRALVVTIASLIITGGLTVVAQAEPRDPLADLSVFVYELRDDTGKAHDRGYTYWRYLEVGEELGDDGILRMSVSAAVPYGDGGMGDRETVFSVPWPTDTAWTVGVDAHSGCAASYVVSLAERDASGALIAVEGAFRLRCFNGPLGANYPSPELAHPSDEEHHLVAAFQWSHGGRAWDRSNPFDLLEVFDEAPATPAPTTTTTTMYVPPTYPVYSPFGTDTD